MRAFNGSGAMDGRVQQLDLDLRGDMHGDLRGDLLGHLRGQLGPDLVPTWEGLGPGDSLQNLCFPENTAC